MSNSSADKARLAELAAFLDAHPQVDHVDACLVDVCGIIRGKRFPRADLEKLFRSGLQFPCSDIPVQGRGLERDIRTMNRCEVTGLAMGQLHE